MHDSIKKMLSKLYGANGSGFPFAIAVVILGFIGVKFTWHAVRHNYILTITFLIIVTLLSLYCRSATHKVPKSNLIVMRGIAVLFGLYIAFGQWSIPIYPQTKLLQPLLLMVNVAGLTLLLTSLRHSTLLLPGLLLLLMQKDIISRAYGLPISGTDYMPVAEFGMLLSIAAIFSKYVRAIGTYLSIAPKMIQYRSINLQVWVLLIAIAVHSANYVFSAAQKLRISEPLWQWITTNPTYYLIAAANQSGSLPISIFGQETSQWIYQALVLTTPMLNLLTVCIQFSALIALRSVKWMIVALLLFDLTHVVIFMITGIFFYKWIILNLLIVAALYSLKKFSYGKLPYLGLVGVMLLAPAIFFVSLLGWHDTPSFNDEYFVAHTPTESHRVPSNYFLAASVTFAQGRISYQKPGHFPTGPMGVLYSVKHDHSNYYKMANCELKPSNLNITNNYNIQGISQKIRQHHDLILKNSDTDGLFEYDFFPHHIWSMPWEYSEFRALDKREIVGYSYVIDSKCLNPDSLESSTPIKRTEFYIDLE